MVRKAFTVRVVVCLALAFALVGGIVVAGAALRHDDQKSTAEPEGPTTSTSTTTTLPPTTTTTIPALVQPPAATTLPVVQLIGYGIGQSDPVIQAYEQRMIDLHFDPGPADGVLDQKTVYALQAVEKLAGLPRVGRLNPAEAAYLQTFQYAPPIHPDAEPNRTEIDVAKQVITLYENYQVRLITTTSTASGQTFCYVTPKKAPTLRQCEKATTPNGRYAFYYFYNGWQDGDLGKLYNPYYFFKGRAIHGYAEVPPQPASHGCARIPMHIAEYWHTLVHDGDPVYVDGGEFSTEQIISQTRI